MLETHLRRVLSASRMNPHFLLQCEVFPKASNARRNASRRLHGLNSFGRRYRRARWPELRHSSSRSYHSTYMKIWRKRQLTDASCP